MTLNEESLGRKKDILHRRSSVFTEGIPENVELEILRHGWANKIITDKKEEPLYLEDINGNRQGRNGYLSRWSRRRKAIASPSRNTLNKRSFYKSHEENERIEIVGSNYYLDFDYYLVYKGRRYQSCLQVTQQYQRRRPQSVAKLGFPKECCATFFVGLASVVNDCSFHESGVGLVEHKELPSRFSWTWQWSFGFVRERRER